MAKIGDAYVDIKPRAKGIEADIKSLLDGPAASAGSNAGGVAGNSFAAGLKTAITAAAVGKIIKDAFDAGGALQQSFGGLDTLYGEASAGAKAYAMAAAEAGISANSYAEQAVSFGAALKAAYDGDTTAAMEAANAAILDMADNAAKLGTPLESVQQAYAGFAKGQYQLLDNLKIGYGGTKTEMERLLADAQKISGVKYDINNLGDVYNAIHVIQEELGLTGVAADEAKNTFSGSFNAMRASWENLLAAMTTGEGLDEAVENLSTSTMNFAENVLLMLGNAAEQTPTLVMGILDALITNAPALIEGGIQLMVNLVTGFIDSLPLIVDAIPELFIAVVEAVAGADWASIGSDIIQAVWDGMVSLWDSVSTWFSERVSSLNGTAYIDVYTRQYGGIDESGFQLPQHATGLNYVPYNNYVAALHEGEMIVPSSLATQLRAAGITPETKSLGGGMPEVSVNNKVSIVFEGELAQLARVLQPYIKAEEERRGQKLIR